MKKNNKFANIFHSILEIYAVPCDYLQILKIKNLDVYYARVEVKESGEYFYLIGEDTANSVKNGNLSVETLLSDGPNWQTVAEVYDEVGKHQLMQWKRISEQKFHSYPESYGNPLNNSDNSHEEDNTHMKPIYACPIPYDDKPYINPLTGKINDMTDEPAMQFAYASPENWDE